MIIGLTGQLGTGKSTAAKILESLGATVIDADRIGHQVVAESAALRKKLASAFGRDIFDANYRLKRTTLAARAFVSTTARDTLNSLVHPYLLKELRRKMKQARKSGPVVIDAALLLDWGMDSEVDLVLVIHAGRVTRIQRALERGFTESDIRARQKAQLPFAEFRRRADRVILNNAAESDLRRKLTAFWRQYLPESN